MRTVIVGGGVLGSLHAWQAIRRGHEVLHVEREAEARGASVRNFGLVWVSGRAPGVELDTAVRARELWEEIGAQVPGLGFRANGSLTVLRTEAEYEVAAAAPDGREFTLLDADRARELNPALRGDFRGALWCPRDAAVEPRAAQPALRQHLAASGRYTWLPGREVRGLDKCGVTDDRGERHDGDVVLLCTGDRLGGLVREMAGEVPVRRVRLQMAQTEPLGEALPTSLADGDSLRYYPAYRGDALDALNRRQPRSDVAASFGVQLLMVQRLDGSLTIGDTHDWSNPFPFDLDEAPYEHLIGVVEAILGRRAPKITRRWAGVYSQVTDSSLVVHRAAVSDNAWLITGPGGRGMTCAPAIAEDTAEEVGL